MFLNLKEINQKEIIKGYKARFVHSKNMTFAYWKIKAGSKLPEHSHIHEQVANIIKGEFKFKIGDETQIIKQNFNSIAIIPSNTKHSGIAITDCEIIDVFYPIREDYKK